MGELSILISSPPLALLYFAFPRERFKTHPFLTHSIPHIFCLARKRRRKKHTAEVEALMYSTNPQTWGIRKKTPDSPKVALPQLHPHPPGPLAWGPPRSGDKRSYTTVSASSPVAMTGTFKPLSGLCKTSCSCLLALKKSLMDLMRMNHPTIMSP